MDFTSLRQLSAPGDDQTSTAREPGVVPADPPSGNQRLSWRRHQAYSVGSKAYAFEK
jgi:hypothetical protein